MFQNLLTGKMIFIRMPLGLILCIATSCTQGDQTPTSPITVAEDDGNLPYSDAYDPLAETADYTASNTEPDPVRDIDLDTEVPGALTGDPFGCAGGYGLDGGCDDQGPIGDETSNRRGANEGYRSGDDFEEYAGAFDNPPTVDPTIDALDFSGRGSGEDLFTEDSRSDPGTSQGPTASYSGDSSFPEEAFGRKVVRYVDALLLNVRSEPNFRAPIVRRLLGGAKIRVKIEGNFAKLQTGQYVSTKFLREQPTRRVSRMEVVKAWRRSKYKDKWVPPGQ